MDGSVTVTGLKELEQAIRVFPDTVQKALRTVALITATRVKDRARATVPYDANHRGSRPHVRDTIVVVPDDAHKQYRVEVGGTALPMLAVWLEYGTSKMSARPFLRPAADAEEDAYKRAMVAAAEAVTEKALGGK